MAEGLILQLRAGPQVFVPQMCLFCTLAPGRRKKSMWEK